ncbi:MAG: lipoate--protein ligase family protein [Spirochaetales bacterium]|nr:lipoate--protein ligase family protein [Spirochaetales bacterium]
MSLNKPANKTADKPADKPVREKSGSFLFVKLPWTSAARNLAAEEYLLDEADPEVSFLLVYENSESLIIGKNQNPWMELALPVLQSGEPPFFRRISGGGAVWQGPGNLNFSFITNRAHFSKEDNLDFVRRALRRFGVCIEKTARGDLTAGGKKVSGNALCFRRGRVLHHGTLLVDAPLEKLKNSLSAHTGAGAESLGVPPFASPFIIETRAVASVCGMPVANLKDFSASLTPDLCVQALLEEALAVYENLSVPTDPGALFPMEKLRALENRHRDRDWLYGATPAFTCRSGETLLTVQNGIITAADPPSGGRFEGKFFTSGLLRGSS